MLPLRRSPSILIAFICVGALVRSSPAYAQTLTSTQFTCAEHGAHGAAQRLTASTLYSTPRNSHPTGVAFGFDLSTLPEQFARGACAGNRPFFLSIVVPDGNYRVRLVLGGPKTSVTTVRAESRRLILLEHKVPAGGSETQSFLVHVRTPGIAGTSQVEAPQKVKLKPREIGALDWDDKLTLEFNGEHPALRSISIEPAPDVPTLYLAGDSTVVDQDKEPWAAWGQMLPVFFSAKLSIANEAESGETVRSFMGENRLAKIMSTIKPGDFLMIQFAHNDQKPGSGYVPAATDYQTYLKRYIAEARAHGATPILVTSMNRRAFDASGHIQQTLGDYPASMRQVAAEEHVTLIDLNAMSKTLFEAMGEEGTLKAFVHYPANTFPNQPEELKDNTHFNAYGAYELARCIVQAVQEQHLPIAAYLRPHIPAFDPAHPDALAAFHVPPSPLVQTDTPYER